MSDPSAFYYMAPPPPPHSGLPLGPGGVPMQMQMQMQMPMQMQMQMPMSMAMPMPMPMPMRAPGEFASMLSAGSGGLNANADPSALSADTFSNKLINGGTVCAPLIRVEYTR